MVLDQRSEVEQFFLEALEQIKDAPLPLEMKLLNRKLYKALKKVVKGREHEEHLKTLRATCQKGNGRQALRILDIAHEFESGKLAASASSGIAGAEIKEMSQLGPYIAQFKLHNLYLESAGHPLPGIFGLEMIKKATESVKNERLVAALATFEARPARAAKCCCFYMAL